jgi:hypothetical protein
VTTISEGEWQRLKNKGCTLLQAMAETDDEKAAEFIPGATTYESAFQDYPGEFQCIYKVEAQFALLRVLGDANRWGWTEDEEEPDWPSLVPEVWPVFNVLGINTEPNIPGERDGPNHDVYFEHYTQTKHDGVVYPVGYLWSPFMHIN